MNSDPLLKGVNPKQKLHEVPHGCADQQLQTHRIQCQVCSLIAQHMPQRLVCSVRELRVLKSSELLKVMSNPSTNLHQQPSVLQMATRCLSFCADLMLSILTTQKHDAMRSLFMLTFSPSVTVQTLEDIAGIVNMYVALRSSGFACP